MNAIVERTRRFARFVKTLGRDIRGEDFTEKTSHLTTAAKVVIVAVAATAAAAGTTVAANNGSKASDHVSQQINSTVGAPAGTTQQSTTPFQVK